MAQGQSALAKLRLMPLTQEDVELVRTWRNESLGGLRTSYPLTEAMQERFYQDIVNDRRSPHRYWGVRDDSLVAMVGLTYIQWENRLAEISLITNPYGRGHGAGSGAVALVLAEAFDNMGLATVCGECYLNNPAVAFWYKMLEKYDGISTTLPRRKFWAGKLWDALYFTFSLETYRETKK